MRHVPEFEEGLTLLHGFSPLQRAFEARLDHHQPDHLHDPSAHQTLAHTMLSKRLSLEELQDVGGAASHVVKACEGVWKYEVDAVENAG